MPLVPLGLQMQAWSRGIDALPSRSKNSIFSSSNGKCIFHEVDTPKVTSKDKTLHNQITNGKKISGMVSPLQNIIEQTREKDKRLDAPDNNSLSLDMSRTSTVSTSLKRKKSTKTKSTNKSKSKKSNKPSTGRNNKKTSTSKPVNKARSAGIKKVQKKRNAQSASGGKSSKRVKK